MRPSGFGEGLSLTDLPPSRDTSVATFCDFHVDARYKSSVEIGPGQCPAWFQSKIVCHGTTTKKNFRTSVDYLPKMKPLKFAQTHFVRPKRLEMTYVSYYDYNSSDNERWFTASVQLVPRSNSSNTVRSYLMKPPKQTGPRRSEVTIVNGRASEVRGDSDDDDDNSSHDGERDSDIEQQLSLGGDINTNIVNKSTTVGGQPSGAVLSPLLMSSGPEDDDEQRFGSTRLSHRTKMVLDTAPSHRDMDGDDYVLYLQGYASTGDDTNKTVNGYHWKIDHVDGYLSEESV